MSVTDEKKTVNQVLLLAAHVLEEAGFRPFTAEALVVKAWQLDPVRLGLKGFPEHPDSNRIYVAIMSATGLLTRGWFEKQGPKLYHLSSPGKVEVVRMLTGDWTSPKGVSGKVHIPKLKLNPEQDARLRRMLQSIAYRRFHEGCRDLANLKDVYEFFSISAYTVGKDVDKMLTACSDTIQKAGTMFINGEIELSDGRRVSRGEIDNVKAAHEFLVARFTRQLDLLRQGAKK